MKQESRIAKPKPFKLKDLPVYSKTLRCSSMIDRLSKLVLGGKYIRTIKEVEDEGEEPDLPPSP